ncbi:MAG: polyprenyl synthetase family protein [Candidatus Promineifilaceae bacterium]
MSILNTKMDLYRAAIAEEMQRVFQSNGASPDGFYGMMHYHMGWVDDQFRPKLSYTGKMIRPILTLLCCEAAGGDWQQALPAAAAIQIIHDFSLVHDDIEDGSPLRRGRPTVWKLWGEPQAINTGDAMFSTAQLAMINLDQRGVEATKVVQAARRLNETCLALTRGQWMDMSFETREDVTVDEYMTMIEGKTSVLIALACELGAIVAGADSDTVSHYAQFGLKLGLAFQVIDDILGIWGNEEEIGKSSESDIMTKKKTLPVLYGLAQNAALRAHYALDSAETDFVLTTITLLDAVSARGYAEAEASQHSETSLGHLAAANPTGDAAATLHHLADTLLKRQS